VLRARRVFASQCHWARNCRCVQQVCKYYLYLRALLLPVAMLTCVCLENVKGSAAATALLLLAAAPTQFPNKNRLGPMLKMHEHVTYAQPRAAGLQYSASQCVLHYPLRSEPRGVVHSSSTADFQADGHWQGPGAVPSGESLLVCLRLRRQSSSEWKSAVDELRTSPRILLRSR
jgi:hypothetical protein